MRRKPGIDLNREGEDRLWVGGGPGVGRQCPEKHRDGGEGRGRWKPRVAMPLPSYNNGL